MITEHLRLTACVLVGSLFLTMIPVLTQADTGAEVTGYITGGETFFSAGAHSAINETVVMVDDNHILASNVAKNDAPQVGEPNAKEETKESVTEYANIAIAQVEIYLNIRAEANTEAEVLGKLYNNSAATVLETLDGWYKITSGSVTGYISSAYVVVGNEELCKRVSERLESGEIRYTYAESREEEAARLAAEEEVRRIKEEERRTQERAWAEAEAARKAQAAAAANKTYNPPAGTNGQAVADYACQFVGNPYVWGGESLTNGADCSGFVKAVYEKFGVSLPHSSYSLRYEGYAVSESELQPGDLVCYSGHVGIYIGDGKIVHASNAKDGIKISSYTYRTVVAFRRIL